MKYLFVLLLIICCSAGFNSNGNNKKQQNEKSEFNMSDTSLHSIRAKNLITELKIKGITNEHVLAAIAKIPRHCFVEDILSGSAYEDKPLPIGQGQTISQPYTVAFQTELLQLKPGEKVLEIGTGSGYQAAVLCEMGAKVYSIERHYQLYVKAQSTLKKLGYDPVLFFGDGYEGLPEHAPFDKILITAAINERPEKLSNQLRIGGWIVAPMGDSMGQTMTVIKRLDTDVFSETRHGSFIFVPMKKDTED